MSVATRYQMEQAKARQTALNLRSQQIAMQNAINQAIKPLALSDPNYIDPIIQKYINQGEIIPIGNRQFKLIFPALNKLLALHGRSIYYTFSMVDYINNKDLGVSVPTPNLYNPGYQPANPAHTLPALIDAFILYEGQLVTAINNGWIVWHSSDSTYHVGPGMNSGGIFRDIYVFTWINLFNYALQIPSSEINMVSASTGNISGEQATSNNVATTLQVLWYGGLAVAGGIALSGLSGTADATGAVAVDTTLPATPLDSIPIAPEITPAIDISGAGVPIDTSLESVASDISASSTPLEATSGSSSLISQGATTLTTQAEKLATGAIIKEGQKFLSGGGGGGAGSSQTPQINQPVPLAKPGISATMGIGILILAGLAFWAYES